MLDIDVEKERVSLGIKQLDDDPIEKAGAGGGALRKDQVVTGTVTEVNDGGIEVELEGGVQVLHPPRRPGPRPQRPAPGTLRQVGNKVDVLVTSVDKAEPQGLGLHQGPRNLAKRRKPWRNTARRTPAPAWATFWARPSRSAPARRRRGVAFVPFAKKKGAPRDAPFSLRTYPTALGAVV